VSALFDVLEVGNNREGHDDKQRPRTPFAQVHCRLVEKCRIANQITVEKLISP
jgi:hypothetical protein